MFIFLLCTILLAIITEKGPEIEVDEMLLAKDDVSDEILKINKLEK